jgi:hypothetical protein
MLCHQRGEPWGILIQERSAQNNEAFGLGSVGSGKRAIKIVSTADRKNMQYTPRAGVACCRVRRWFAVPVVSHRTATRARLGRASLSNSRHLELNSLL